MLKKGIIPFFMSIIIVFSLFQPSFAQTNMFAYVNPDYQLFMLYPNGWEITEGLEGHMVSFLSPYESYNDIYREAFSVTTEDLQPCAGITLDRYLYNTISELKYYMSNLIPIGDMIPTSIDGLPAYLISYQFFGNQEWIYNMEAITIYDNTAYIFIYTKSPNDQEYRNSFETVLDMIETIKIGESFETDTPSQSSSIMNVRHDPSAKCGYGSSMSQFDYVPQ